MVVLSLKTSILGLGNPVAVLLRGSTFCVTEKGQVWGQEVKHGVWLKAVPSRPGQKPKHVMWNTDQLQGKGRLNCVLQDA